MGFDKRFRDFYEATFVHVRDGLDCSVERYFSRVVPNIAVQHAYIDMNSVVVEAVRSLGKGKRSKQRENFTVEKFFKQLDEDANLVYPKQPSAALMERVCKKIIKTVDAFYHGVFPSVTFMIALDGPAQLAKFDTRRDRNYDRVKRDGKSYVLSDNNSDYISALQISPGTFFMYHVEKALDEWMTQASKQAPKKRFILDGATTAGEGELKIIRAIHATQALNDTHVVLSPDSDMYMSVLNCMHKPNIYVFKHQFGCSVVSKTNMLSNMAQNFGISHLDWIARDITFIGLLYGSDFTKSQPFFNNPREIMKRYHDTVASSNNNFLIDVVGDSTSLNMQRFASMINVPATPATFEDNAVAILENYLTSVLWVLDQYVHGKCRDYPFATTKPLEWNPAVFHELAKQKPRISVTFTPAPHPYLPIISSILVHKHSTIIMSLLPPKILEALKNDNHTHLFDKVVKSASVHEVGTTLHEIISKYGRDDMQAWEHYALDAIPPALYVAGKSTPIEEKPFKFSEPQVYTKEPEEKTLFRFGKPKRKLENGKESVAKKAKHDTPKKEQPKQMKHKDEKMPDASKMDKELPKPVIKPTHIKLGVKENDNSKLIVPNPPTLEKPQPTENTDKAQLPKNANEPKNDVAKASPIHTCSEPKCSHSASFTIQSTYLCFSHYKTLPNVVQSLCQPLATQSNTTITINAPVIKEQVKQQAAKPAPVPVHQPTPTPPRQQAAKPAPIPAHKPTPPWQQDVVDMDQVASVVRNNQGVELGSLSNLLRSEGITSTRGMRKHLLAHPHLFQVQLGENGTCYIRTAK